MSENDDDDHTAEALPMIACEGAALLFDEACSRPVADAAVAKEGREIVFCCATHMPLLFQTKKFEYANVLKPSEMDGHCGHEASGQQRCGAEFVAASELPLPSRFRDAKPLFPETLLRCAHGHASRRPTR